ncbi:hypothetical protein ACLI4Z_00590 [Natrialbaceae archaeon A-arb3/5]
MSVRQLLAAIFGCTFIVVGVLLAIGSQPAEDWSTGATFVAILVALVAFLVALWKVWGSLEGGEETPAVPWATDEPFANPAPERTDREPPLSSDGLVAVVEDAGATARSEGTVDDGLAVARPALREVLCDALEQGDRSRSAAEAAIEDGSWTDDPVAASVLSADLAAPSRTFRERLFAWLFPERVVRRRIGRTVGELAETADEALPTIPGQTAPRPVPVVRPCLEDLHRGADGRPQRARNPNATARGPRPPRARTSVSEQSMNGTAQSEGDDAAYEGTDESAAGNPNTTVSAEESDG